MQLLMSILRSKPLDISKLYFLQDRKYHVILQGMRILLYFDTKDEMKTRFPIP